MNVVVIKYRLLQVIEVIQGAERLGKFLMQTIANFLRSDITWKKDAHLLANFLSRPTCLSRVALSAKLI